MDRERLGRVLGRGARLAARTAYEAVDAATAQSPTPAQSPAPPRSTAAPQPVAPQIIPPVQSTRTAAPPQPTTRDYAQVAAAAMQGVAAAKQGVSAAKKGMGAPLKKASKQLWHEISGCFFALFAFSFFGAVWKTRENAVSAIPDTRYRFYAFCALALLFLYFSVSSFVRARRVR